MVTHRRERLLLPPIVEQQEGKYVVIDGHHRLYFTSTESGKASTVWCIVLRGLTGLPGTPVPFAELKVTTEDWDRSSVFINYVPENYREIGLLDAELKKGK